MIVLPDPPSPSLVPVEADLIPQSVIDLLHRLRSSPMTMPVGELHCDHPVHDLDHHLADVPAEDWGQ